MEALGEDEEEEEAGLATKEEEEGEEEEKEGKGDDVEDLNGDLFEKLVKPWPCVCDGDCSADCADSSIWLCCLVWLSETGSEL